MRFQHAPKLIAAICLLVHLEWESLWNCIFSHLKFGNNPKQTIYSTNWDLQCLFALLSCRLALYVYEYLLHVGAQKSAQTFLSEVSVLAQSTFPSKHLLLCIQEKQILIQARFEAKNEYISVETRFVVRFIQFQLFIYSKYITKCATIVSKNQFEHHWGGTITTLTFVWLLLQGFSWVIHTHCKKYPLHMICKPNTAISKINAKKEFVNFLNYIYSWKKKVSGNIINLAFIFL